MVSPFLNVYHLLTLVFFFKNFLWWTAVFVSEQSACTALGSCMQNVGPLLTLVSPPPFFFISPPVTFLTDGVVLGLCYFAWVSMSKNIMVTTLQKCLSEVRWISHPSSIPSTLVKIGVWTTFYLCHIMLAQNS